MKKIIVTTSVVLLIGLVSVSAYAWNGCGGYGYGNGHHMMSSYTGEYQSFYDDTSTLQASISADRAEMHALMNSENPDPKRVRVLTKQISKSEIELRKIAKKYNIGSMGMRSYGQGWNCGITGHGHAFTSCW